MKKSHPKYKIKKDDTLQSITKLFGVNESVWKQYHNNLCRLEHLIKEKLPENLEEIFLLPELWDKAEELHYSVIEKDQKKKEKVSFGYDNTLIIKSYPEMLRYSIVLTLSNDDKVNTIQYENSIRWISRRNDEHIIEVNKLSNIFINGHEPDLLLDQLSAKVASVLYPLELIVTRKDGIIGINNREEIQKRWEIIKQEIKKYYEGGLLEKYLQLNDKVINSADSGILLRNLQNDWFLFGYFDRIYETYGTNFSFINKIRVPFIFNSTGVEYTVVQNINSMIGNSDFIVIEMEGTCTDDRSVSDLKNGLNYSYDEYGEKETGKYWSRYFLEPEYNIINAFFIEATLEKSKRKISLSVSKIIN